MWAVATDWKVNLPRLHFIIMENIEEIIIKDKTLITCDNEKCEYKGAIYFCYNENERKCGIYKGWERKLIRGGVEDE